MPNTDKTILLPQLQRYDQKIKGWADNKFLTKADTPSLPKATATTLGGVKVGNGLNVTDDGTLSAKTHGSETSITTLITATYDNTGIWNVVCNDTYDVIASWFDNYDRVLALVKSGENSLRPFPQDFVELIKIREGLIVSTPFTIQYVVPSNNPRVRTGMTTTALCQIYFNANGSISFQMGYSKVDQYADATEFTNTVNEGVSMLALKDGGITSAKLANSAITAAKLASNAVTSDKITNGAVSSVKIASNAVTAGKIVDGAITAAKLASGAVNTDKIADGAITKAKLGSDVVIPEAYTLPEATASTLGGVKVYGVLSSNLIDSPVVPLAKSKDNLLVLQTYTSRNSNEMDGYVVTQTDNKQWPGIILKNKTVTTDKIADGAITADKLAKGAGGGGSIFNLGALSKGTILSIVSFDCGNFIMYLVTFNIEPTPSGSQISYKLHGTNLLISPKSTGTVHIVPPSVKSGFYSYTLTWFQPKSDSAKAALATLLPVQDECEQMEAEVAKLEQDWIDNQDETVAVDGNGVPITIATKKTDLEKKKEELEKKKAELEKLREDYFSKLGDWKNEVQE